MVRTSAPPLLLQHVFDDLGEVHRLLERQAPYTPLGGWYNPGADPHAATRAMWFQNDWVHDTFKAPGSELFLHNPTYIEGAKRYAGVEVVEPHSVYVNLMAAITEGGPAHTDNPRFHGRDRTNTPMWLLRAMLWSTLFDDHEIVQATAIWWMNDVEGGALRYWPDGPHQPPHDHVGAMANTALLGDNHGMFHQVGPVGPFDRGTVRLTPLAELAPARDGTGDWVVTDHGEERWRAPLHTYRVSVLWKADLYRTAEEAAQRKALNLSMQDVEDRFNDDLARRGSAVRFTCERADDLTMKAELATEYPEAIPVDALV
jgi:hypothetical protein